MTTPTPLTCASYVVLAQRLGIPFVTADEKLVNALSGTTYPVYSLRTFPIPPQCKRASAESG